jgi:CPA2 family monovalent cation:H+ antiporter-2
LEALGISRTEAERMLAAFEQMDRDIMIELADLYDINIPIVDNEPYLKKAREMREEWEQQLKGKMRQS